MRVYLSGGITGVRGYREHFKQCEEKLTDMGFTVINPAKVSGEMPDDTAYEDYVELAFVMLKSADAIYMLDGWERSRGARKELGLALYIGKEVMYETVEKSLENGLAAVKKEKENALTEEQKQLVETVINYLNEVCGTSYKTDSKDAIKQIKARINEGNTFGDFKIVIDKKAREWLGTNMESYLRPKTLFGTKFDNYRGQKVTSRKNGDIDWSMI